MGNYLDDQSQTTIHEGGIELDPGIGDGMSDVLGATAGPAS